MKLKPILILFIACLQFACTKDKTSDSLEYDTKLRGHIAESAKTNNLSYYIFPSPNDLDNIPQDPKNRLTREKVELGKQIFYDTGLAMDAVKQSGMGTYSCASCHLPTAGFRPNSAQGIADGGIGFGTNGEERVKSTEYEENELDVQSARPLSLVNVAYVTNTFWNGQFGATGVNKGTDDVWGLREDTDLNEIGYQGIETQNIDGLRAHRITINKPLLDKYGYTPLFDAAFPTVSVTERYTRNFASLAVSAYIRTILADEAPFQKWLKGDDDALSLEEKKGAIVFFDRDKGKCTNCHFRPNLGSLDFEALGVRDMYQSPSFNTDESDRRNLGRGGFTLKEEDNYKFKVPQLYNLADASHFFHGSSKRTLDEVIDYKIKAQTENTNIPQDKLSVKFTPLTLTDEEKDNLLLFLTNSLRDPNLTRYAPTEVMSGFCFPNNDAQSRIDLGCN